MTKTITLTNAEHEDILEALDLLRNSRRALNATYGETPASNLTELENLTNRILQTQDGFASVWTLDDVLDMIDEDEGTQNLDARTTEMIAKRLLASVENRLLNIFAERGNDYISQRWTDDAEDLIRESTQASSEVI